MRIIYDRLYKLMQDHGITTRQLAFIAGTSTIAVWFKLRGFLKWQLHEALRICVFFRVPDAEDLFSN